MQVFSENATCFKRSRKTLADIHTTLIIVSKLDDVIVVIGEDP